MKKVKLLLCMLSVAAMGLLTACDDDDNGGGGDGGGGGTTNAPPALTAGDSMTFTPADPEFAPYTVTFDGAGGYTTDFEEVGTYAYGSDGANGATLTLDPTTPDLDPLTYALMFTALDSGSYDVNAGVETGTFTFSDAPAPEDPPPAE